MEIVQSFTQIPETVLKMKLGSLRAVYVYAKLAMLREHVYKRDVWVTNPISKQKEMSTDAFTDAVNRLEKAGLVKRMRIDVGSKYKENKYEIIPQGSYYKPVCNDYLNHPLLSPEAKGLGILMSLFKDVPKGYSQLAKATGISNKTVKKYLLELEHEGVYDANVNLLNGEYFPYWQHVNAKREKKAQKIIEDFKTWISVQEEGDAQPNYYTRMMEWVRRLKEPEEVKAYVWRKVICGLLRPGICQENKPETVPVRL